MEILVFTSTKISLCGILSKIHKYESHLRDLEPKAKTKWVQHHSQREGRSRTPAPSQVEWWKHHEMLPTARGKAALTIRGVSDPFWMSCCWLLWSSTNLKPSQYDLHSHCDFDNKMKLTKSSSLTIFASAWNSYISTGNNLFKGITWANIRDFAHSFVKWLFLQLVSALEVKDESASPQAGLSVLHRNCIVVNGCLKGRNMNEIEENVSQNKT